RGGRGGAPAAAGAAMSTIKKDQAAHCEPTLTIPANARVTEPYWHRKGEAGRYTFDADAPFGLPYRPTPFVAQVTLVLNPANLANPLEIVDRLPVQYRYGHDIFSGEKRDELLVVPAYSVRVSPEIAILPAATVHGAAAGRSPTSATREV